MFDFLKRLFGFGRSKVRASYDAASTDDENRRHWADADSLQADAVADPSTRQLIRDRARLEYRNNGYCAGLVDSLANDLIGTGPRPQVSIPGVDRDVGRQIEKAWANWARACDLAEDLWLLDVMDIRDGEGFAMFIDNPELPRSQLTPVQLDLLLFESEQVADPAWWGYDPLYVDGIRRDRYGNPTEYTFLESHPGGVNGYMRYATKPYPASEVIHWFTPNRAGQVRGVSRLAPILNLFGDLRRYTKATILAAELQASIAGVLSTNQPAPDQLITQANSIGGIEIVRNMLLTTPEGWDAKAFDASQPTTTYPQFNQELASQIGRPLQAPLNKVTANSSPYNYSSAKLDDRIAERAIACKRRRLNRRVMDRIFLKWVPEAALAGAIPERLPPVAEWSWMWHYDGPISADPTKDADAAATLKENGLQTDAEYYAAKGQDWEEAYEQLAKEAAKRKELGLDGGEQAPPAALPATLTPEVQRAA